MVSTQLAQQHLNLNSRKQRFIHGRKTHPLRHGSSWLEVLVPLDLRKADDDCLDRAAMAHLARFGPICYILQKGLGIHAIAPSVGIVAIMPTSGTVLEGVVFQTRQVDGYVREIAWVVDSQCVPVRGAVRVYRTILNGAETPW
jgi:hypothetical protein